MKLKWMKTGWGSSEYAALKFNKIKILEFRHSWVIGSKSDPAGLPKDGAYVNDEEIGRYHSQQEAKDACQKYLDDFIAAIIKSETKKQVEQC